MKPSLWNSGILTYNSCCSITNFIILWFWQVNHQFSYLMFHLHHVQNGGTIIGYCNISIWAHHHFVHAYEITKLIERNYMRKVDIGLNDAQCFRACCLFSNHGYDSRALQQWNMERGLTVGWGKISNTLYAPLYKLVSHPSACDTILCKFKSRKVAVI